MNQRTWLPLFCLLLAGAVYALFYLNLGSRWWFEDDPSLFAYANTIVNPLRILVDPEALRHFTVGKSLTPAQLFSYWIDLRVAGYSTQFAYAHQMCSFLIALFLLYCLLVYALQGERIATACIAALSKENLCRYSAGDPFDLRMAASE